MLHFNRIVVAALPLLFTCLAKGFETCPPPPTSSRARGEVINSDDAANPVDTNIVGMAGSSRPKNSKMACGLGTSTANPLSIWTKPRFSLGPQARGIPVLASIFDEYKVANGSQRRNLENTLYIWQAWQEMKLSQDDFRRAWKKDFCYGVTARESRVIPSTPEMPSDVRKNRSEIVAANIIASYGSRVPDCASVLKNVAALSQK